MKAIPAKYAGKCSATGDNYDAGALIVKTRDGWELVTVGNRPVILAHTCAMDMPKSEDETPTATAQRPGPCNVTPISYRTAPQALGTSAVDPQIIAGVIQAVGAIISGLWHR